MCASPFTVQPGIVYLENFPLWIYVPGNGFSCQYQWPLLIRVGIREGLEFRLQTSGLTHNTSSKNRYEMSGLSPIALGFKLHLWGTQESYYVPSAALEAFIVTPIASSRLRDGIQYIINGLFEVKFCKSLRLEWNIGGYTRSNLMGKKHSMYAVIEWSLEQEITDNMILFFEGLYNSALLPCFDKTLILGAGFLSYVSDRVALYGSYNWSVYKTTNPELANLGCAIAF